jgi:hypothetical protein
VPGDEDRQVADDLDAMGVGVGLELGPLGEKAPLRELPEVDFVGVCTFRFAQRRRFAVRERCRPLLPQRAIVALVGDVQGHEQRVIIEPRTGVGAESRKGRLLARLFGGEEAAGGAAQELHSERPHARVIDALFRESRRFGEIGWG